MTEKVEITDEHKEKAKEMRKSYDEERPTIALPGSGNSVTGTAVNDWVDDDGSPKFGEVENEVERPVGEKDSSQNNSSQNESERNESEDK